MPKENSKKEYSLSKGKPFENQDGIKFGAGDGIRTRDPDLGKVVLYQLSYTRIPNSDRQFTIIEKNVKSYFKITFMNL